MTWKQLTISSGRGNETNMIRCMLSLIGISHPNSWPVVVLNRFFYRPMSPWKFCLASRMQQILVPKSRYIEYRYIMPNMVWRRMVLCRPTFSSPWRPSRPTSRITLSSSFHPWKIHSSRIFIVFFGEIVRQIFCLKYYIFLSGKIPTSCPLVTEP